MHKREVITEAALEIFFGMDQVTVYRYLKAVNGALTEILPAACNLIDTIRGIYERCSGSDSRSSATAERYGPLSASGPPSPVMITDGPPVPPS